jgi:hypothetical protein
VKPSNVNLLFFFSVSVKQASKVSISKQKL